MYSIIWAEERAKEHYCSHTRASELLVDNLQISLRQRALWLANASYAWEAWKYLCRMVENAWDIRDKPNTQMLLDTTQALSAVSICLRADTRYLSEAILTGIKLIRTLREHECVRIAGLPASISISSDDGQLPLFGDLRGYGDDTRVSGSEKHNQPSSPQNGPRGRKG